MTYSLILKFYVVIKFMFLKEFRERFIIVLGERQKMESDI